MCGEDRSDVNQAQIESQNTARDQGVKARTDIIKAGQASPEEKQLQTRYMTKMNQTPESLLTEAGPVSQAVAQRIQERVNNPGMDYDVSSINTAIGNPIWAGLKARGITAPAGSEGGGLGTEQYMQQMVPYLAEGRQNQINTDITRGQTYGQSALTQSNLQTSLADAISQALSNRNLQATETGVPYEVSGANKAAEINQNYYDTKFQEQQAQNEAIGKMVAMALVGAATGGIGAAAIPAAGLSVGAGTTLGALGGIGGAMGGGSTTTPNYNSLALANSIRNPATLTPYDSQLNAKITSQGIKNAMSGSTNPYGY